MQVVIDIDEKQYNIIKNDLYKTFPTEMKKWGLEAIRNGIPLDKIKAEIEQNAYPIVHGVNNHEKGMTLYGILQVIDKYKAESEDNKDGKV